MGNEVSQPCSGKKLDNDIKVTWRKLQRCPYQPREGQSCAVSGNTMFVFGGVLCTFAKDDAGQQTVCNRETNQLLKFDIEKNAWEEVHSSGDIPEPRSGSTLAAVGDKLYMFGGLSGDEGWLDDLYKFDTGSSEWTKIKDFEGEPPSPRDKLTSCAIGGSIYIFGGFGPDQLPCNTLDDIVEEADDDDEYEDIEIRDIEREMQAARFTWFGDMHRYDTVSNQWTLLSSPSNGDSLCPSPRAAHSMCVVEKSLLVFGGRDSFGRQNDIWSFSPDVLKWTEKIPTGCKPHARSFHAAEAVGKRMVVLGGRGIDNLHFQDFHIYDNETNQWLLPSIERGILPPAMGMHSLASVNQGIILCFGTSDIDPITNSCTTLHQDCFSVCAEHILSGGALVSSEDLHEARQEDRRHDQNNLPEI